MKQVIIVGKGGSGCEIASWLATQKADFFIKGFIDDIKTDKDVLGTIENYCPTEGDVFVCSIGSSSARIAVVTELEQRGAQFINVVHPSAVVLGAIHHLRGLIIAPFVYIAHNAKLGDFVSVNIAASVGHNAEVGDGCTVSAHCDITGHVKLGKRVFMGSHACIIPGKTVGDDAIIGAGSAVMCDVPPNTTVVGVPAKRLM